MPLDYYQEQAAQFFQDTQAVDMGPLYQRVLPMLMPDGYIVDVGCGCGCGSGRDMRHCCFMDFHMDSKRMLWG